MNRRSLSALFAAGAVLSAVGCDWAEYSFLNSVPLDGTSRGEMFVYLGVDGLSWSTVQDAMAQGAFAGPEWSLARFATIFPGTSDASWTRILRTERIDGYELEYFDPERDELVHGGLLGGARHVLPTVSESLSFEARYLDAFDYRSNGYAHSILAYSAAWVSAAETLDNLFFALEGRIETSSVFTGYVLEADLLGHLSSREDCTRFLMILARRIEEFRRAHPERRIHFTILSDHGMDFTPIPKPRFVDLREELPKVGVAAVERLRGDPARLYAVPVIHTRVTYVALHTAEALTAEVAESASRLESIDFAAGRLAPAKVPPSTHPEGEPGAEWFGLWSAGRLAAWFGYDRGSSVYLLPAEADLERFGITVHVEGGGAFERVHDEDLFDRTSRSIYPDLLYRVRTALGTLGVKHPAEVLVSFRPGWCSIGFRLPGSVDIFGPGYHGAAAETPSTGVLLSDESALPPVVRSDSFLALFPRARAHLVERGLVLENGDADAARPLRRGSE